MGGLVEQIDEWIISGIDAYNNLSDLLKIGSVLVVGIIMLLGTFELIKKVSKLVIFLVIIAVVVYAIDYLEIFDVPGIG
ncbi:MAG: hypothetical protein KAI29_17340 [Cyclobacteriaceae bacterium]|nr:hypothetical protein [Cyclobacteriaceae bacterium]